MHDAMLEFQGTEDKELNFSGIKIPSEEKNIKSKDNAY